MTELKKEARGAAWKNEYKTEDWHPDFTGNFTLNAKEYFLDIWIDLSGENNRPPISLRVKEKDPAESVLGASEGELDAMQKLAGISGNDPANQKAIRDHVPGGVKTERGFEPSEEFNDDIPF